ncbi:MAG: hypothetical protein NTX03_05365, partial [Bacteroidetes bacterium]|nr:hypothetical protein [Bacteroidota bacterium]
GNDNLNEIAIAEVSIKGKNYYALLLYDVKGYDLDVKKEDDLTWKNFPCVEYYVFPKSELKNIRLDSLKAGGKFTQSIQYLFYGAFNNSIPQNLNFEMKRHIEWNIVQDHPKESKTDAYFQFFLNPVKLKTGATVLRFNITMIYPPIGEKPKRTIDYRVFTYQFYEVPFEKWKQFVVSLPKK